MRGTAVGEVVEGDLGGGVLGLTESVAVLRALEDLAVKVDGGLEPGRVVGTFPNARVGRQIEAAPLGQLLQLVLVHFALYSKPTLGANKLSSPHRLAESRVVEMGAGPRSDRRRFGPGRKGSDRQAPDENGSGWDQRFLGFFWGWGFEIVNGREQKRTEREKGWDFGSWDVKLRKAERGKGG